MKKPTPYAVFKVEKSTSDYGCKFVSISHDYESIGKKLKPFIGKTVMMYIQEVKK